MGLKTSLRTTPALWAAPLVCFLVWYVSDYETSGGLAYWGGNTTIAGHVVPFYAPACAACAAWQAGRLRRAGIARLAPVRGRYVTAAQALWPVALLGVLGVGVALATARLNSGPARDWPHPGVLALCGLLIVVHCVIGYVAGSALPRLLAPPLVLVADYLALTLPVTTTDPLWLREITGWLNEPVNDLTSAVNPMALIAPALLAAGIAAAVVVGAELRSRTRAPLPVSLGCAAVCLAVFAAAAVWPVRNWDGQPPVYARTDAPVCSGHAPRICVPTELSPDLPRLGDTAHRVLPRLDAAGVARPRTLALVSETVEVPSTTWRLNLRPGLTSHQITAGVAVAALPEFPACRRYVGNPLMLQGWLMFRAGLDAGHVSPAVGQAVVRTLQHRVLTLPVSRQGDWYRLNVRRMTECRPAAGTDVDYASKHGS
ncbi:hypothetical protein [Streptomyces sp. NPDC005435]|uniref:DUF7224 domain-containing protein n=1 Tax=Streptomyces sp. NPDC005435 TaxID=3154464 RepID=UPI003452416B